MKTLVIKYRYFLKFVLTFSLTYIAFLAAYKLYLDYSTGDIYYPDFFTDLVSRHCQYFFELLNYNIQLIDHPKEASIKVIFENKYVARIIEGCNSVSTIMLFMSFVIAFADNFKSTFLFLIFGCILIYLVNLIRIVILTIWIYYYPMQIDISHDIVFPLIIYGTVVLLWMIWVNRFNKIYRDNE